MDTIEHRQELQDVSLIAMTIMHGDEKVGGAGNRFLTKYIIDHRLYNELDDAILNKFVWTTEQLRTLARRRQSEDNRCQPCDALLAARHALEVALPDDSPLISMMDKAISGHGHEWMLREYKED